MTWQPNNPNTTNEILEIPPILEGNFTAIDQACILEHQPLSGTSASGQHIPGIVGVVRRDTTAAISLLSSPATGALAWDTDRGILEYFTGAAWQDISSQKWSRVRAYLATTNVAITSGAAAINIPFNGISYNTLSEFVTGSTAAFTTRQSGFYLITSTVSVQGSGTQDLVGMGNPSSDVSTGWFTTPTLTSHYLCVDSYPATADTFYVTSRILGAEDLYLTGSTILSGFSYRKPVGNGTAQWTPRVNTNWQNVSAYPTYNAPTLNGSYNSISSTNSTKSDIFANPFSIPSSATNIVLTISLQYFYQGLGHYPPADAVSGCIGVGGTQYVTDKIPFSSHPNNFEAGIYTYSWSVNPYTTLPWTSEEINDSVPGGLAEFGYLGIANSPVWACISDVHLEVTYNYPTGSSIDIPSDSTGIEVKAHYRLKSRPTSSIPNIHIQPSIAKGATIHYGTATLPTTAFKDYVYSWNNDPSTGLPWTSTAAMEVTGVGLKVYSVGSPATSADCSLAYLEVLWYPPRPVVNVLIIKNSASASTSAVLAQTFKPIHESGFGSGQTAKVTTVASLSSGDKINIKCSKSLMNDEIMGDILGQNTFVCIHRLSGIGGL